jgi:D-glucosaminate-6-phosphate ammonia-lyase
VTDFLDRLGLTRVINATGTVTRLGASRIAPEVIAAMAAVAQCSVDIAQLQERASEVIAGCTGAEAGIVTAGASAALLVGAAACMTGLDPVKMSQLPDTTALRNEFVISRSHRNSYDHAVRAAGGRLVEVGLPDRLTGCGVRDTEAWEVAAAIGERTAGILYLARADARPELAAVVKIARAANIPVLVDAAAELPPAHNLRRFIEAGADLVAFSGGKSLGGPSASGILCGRRRLVAAALLQQLDLDYVSEDWEPPAMLVDKRELAGVPRHGIGRSCKVGKEQIAGLLAALLRFAAVGDQERNQRWHAVVDSLVEMLTPLTALRVKKIEDAGHGDLPLVAITVAPGADAPDPGLPNARQLAARLRAGTPSVHVDSTSADTGTLILIPTCLAPEDAGPVAAAFAAALAGGSEAHPAKSL